MEPDLDSTATIAPPNATRRRRLWQLPATLHLPLIGLCLEPMELRRLTDRLFHGRTDLDDARLLTGVAKECGTRNKVSDALQRTFDTRFVHSVTAFRTAKSPEALAALWQECLAGGNVGACLWSTSTHPCADETLHSRMGRDVQMLQFRAVLAKGAERQQVEALLLENGVLAREMARIQQRHTRWHVERREEQAELAALRLELIRTRAEMATRARPADGLATRARPADGGEPAVHADGADERRSEVAAAQADSVAQPIRPTAPTAKRVPHPPVLVAGDAAVDAPVALIERALVDAEGAARRILCVGGRTGHVPVYRALVEEQGGRFLHHDGGVEDNPRRLEAQLSAADLVICQTGCLSHNAYWRVKDHCKRTGTPCVYLDKPGAGSFLRGLVLAVPPAEPITSGSAVEQPD